MENKTKLSNIDRELLEDFFQAFVGENTDPIKFSRPIWSEKTVTECAGIDFHVQELKDVNPANYNYQIPTGIDYIDKILEGGLDKDYLGLLIGDASCNEKLLDSINIKTKAVGMSETMPKNVRFFDEQELLAAIKTKTNGMMTDVKTTIVYRKNLKPDFRNLPFEKIEWQYFKFNGERRFFDMESLVLFIDEDYNTKILKNRWGKNGDVK